MDFGFYRIDFSWAPDFLAMSLPETMWWFFVSGAWVLFAIFFLWVAKIYWLQWRQGKYAATLEFVLLAIDVPRENMQSPKAVEHIFNQMWGICAEPSPKEKWIYGQFSLAFSFELVSIGGYIQFIVRTPKPFKDVVEAAFYAQYPEAEITEIRDYTKDFDLNFREKGYNLWGSEVVLANDQYYPIRTYPSFEHTMTQKYADPLAAILELFSKLGPGEQIWFQIVAKPASDSWKGDAEKLINKLLGIKEGWKKTALDKVIESPLVAMERMGDFVFNRPEAVPQESGSEGEQSNFFNLPPHIQEAVKALGMKASKAGFTCKVRAVYVAKNEVFAKSKVVPTFFGALKQFAALNLNGFKPGKGTMTSAKGWLEFRNRQLVKERQDKILTNYKSRSGWAGVGRGFILNTEELASIYHFPGVDLRVPAVQAVAAKKGEAPAFLPMEEASPFVDLKKGAVEGVKKEEKGVDDLDEFVEPGDEEVGEPGPTISKPGQKKQESSVETTKAGPPSNLPIG